mmetsp:Transcript_20973/g.45472  ORF Transcript_20973/g.45472 Transcript_20973/m.45472 type:complete len:424 (-) Transcript_20973:163-1434(-)|eukprot:CAMPEP_0172317116 /NCGR_PEP_ID=MMETSP1058-20130122/30566_1 /TAXON_ID=83371 /ORGANISM="Detonula confervacea, Strain CCMP 353" /LENGTH=423 /DNA_ID=CAMNT_0013031587 /DNA_START=152 /DNA_END=1423 /DNA_ORIENTATION=-
MATQILAKGPLSSALGQYIFLGVGTLFIFTGDNGVSKAAQQIANVAFRLVTGRSDGVDFLREAALGHSATSSLQGMHHQQQQQPIVIHSHAPSSSGRNDGTWTTTIVNLTLASGACWTAYIIFTNYLPDSIKEMMPVTRKFFESAVSSLGNGILRVRDVLSEQIAALGTKQDELANKQDETHESVLGLKDDIGSVRLHIDDIAVAISRCEGSLTDAAGRQTYMTQGVRLLVQCVGDLMRPSNPTVAAELDKFSRMSAELTGDSDDFGYDGGDKHLECPSSPNLSEIGSTASTSIDDGHHHHHHNMRSLSVPRPRRFQSVVTPSNAAPNSARKNMMSPPPLSLSMASPPPSRAMRMLQSFSGGGSSRNSTATTASSSSSSSSSRSSSRLSRAYSSPEDEVPQSDHDPVKLEEVNELLRKIRSGN